MAVQMGKANNNLPVDDDDIIILSSDSEDEAEVREDNRSTFTCTEQETKIKKEKSVDRENNSSPSKQIHETSTSSGRTNNNIENVQKQNEARREPPNEPQIQEDVASTFAFNELLFFGPGSESMPIEDRLNSFISNVQSLTMEKIKLENAERQAKRQCKEATTQLANANREISKLKVNLGESENKLKQQNKSINELQELVARLKRQENWTKSKQKSITTTLINLQAKMVQILEEAEVDGSSPSEFEQAGPVARQRNPALTLGSDEGTESLAQVLLKENIENLEKDFETKFSQLEEQDKEIKDELNKTSEMIQHIQSSLLEKFQFQAQSSASSSPQLTFESMEDQNMDYKQYDQIPGTSNSTYRSGTSN